MKEIQIFRKEIQAGRNKFQIRRNKIQIQILAFLRRFEPFQGFTPTPTAFFSFRSRFRPQTPRQSRRRLFAGKLFVSPPVFVFGSSGCLSNEAKGWRLFMIADAWARFSPTCRPRSLIE